jgi:hypothetical protein
MEKKVKLFDWQLGTTMWISFYITPPQGYCFLSKVIVLGVHF